MENFSLFEGKLLLWLQDNVRTDFLNTPLCFITRTKVTVAVWALFLLVLFLFKKTRKASLAGGCGAVLSFLTCNLILKNIFDRARPFVVIEQLQIIGKIPGDSSFPSGHTSLCFACAAAVCFFVPKKLAVPGFCFAFLIAFTRLYVGAHFPSDVFFGMINGILCGIISFFLCRFVFNKAEKKEAVREFLGE